MRPIAAGASPFHERTAKVLAALAVASFLAGALSAIFSRPGEGVAHPEASALSRSAVGHAAFVRLLERAGLPVIVSARRTEARLEAGAALILAEPSVAGDDERVERLLGLARASLLVLPKHAALPDGRERDWARDLVDESEGAEAALRAAGVRADVVLAETLAGDAWALEEGLPAPAIERPQLIRPIARIPPRGRGERIRFSGPGGLSVRALVSRPEGILLGETVGPEGKPLLLLADPDPIETHGIGDGENALLAVRIVERLRELAGGDATLVVDESLHPQAAALARPPSLYEELLTPPLLCASAQALALAALLLWASIGRFGAPLPLPRAVEPGSAALIAHTARQLEQGGHAAYALDRVWREARRRAARALGAPPGLDEDGEVEHLDRVLHARGARVDVTDLCARVRRVAAGEAAAPPFRVLALAREVDQFLREALRGSRDGS